MIGDNVVSVSQIQTPELHKQLCHQLSLPLLKEVIKIMHE